MLPEVSSALQRSNSFLDRLEGAAKKIEPSDQFVLANALVLRACGLVEETIYSAFGEYMRRRSCERSRRFVLMKVTRMNSFDCEKIKTLLDEFDMAWWSYVEDNCPQACLASIDSLKAIRDQIAHGRHNGTGFVTVKQYYSEVVKFPKPLCDIVLR